MSQPQAIRQLATPQPRMNEEVSKEQLQGIIGTGPVEVVEPQVRIEQEVECSDHLRQRISYWTEPEDRGWGYLLIPRPRSPEPRPLVICPHQTVAFAKEGPVGLADEEQYHYGLHLVRRGLVCFAPDQFAAGQRLKKGQKAYDTSDLYRRWSNWSAGGKALWDLQRALDFLVDCEFVDPQQIGVIGHSLGGHDSLLLAAFDQRVKAAVVNCGVSVLRTDPRRQAFARTNERDYIYYRRLQPYLTDPQNLPFDFDRMAMMVAPRALMMIHAINDRFFPGNAAWFDAGRHISDHFDRAGRPQAFVTYMHRKGHGFPPEARDLAYSWLEEALCHSSSGENISE